MSQPWTDKHHPHKLDEVVGQGQTTRGMLEWAEEWKKGRPKKPALLLYGPPGTGKSAAATALAGELGWDLIELNASDKRTLKEIERVAGSAATTGTLTGTGEKRLIILDEADNVHGTADRGGYSAISKLLDQTQNPIVLVANNRYEVPGKIRRNCVELNFRRLTKRSIVRALDRISKAEKIKADPGALELIAENAGSDLRSAINDLQAMAMGRRELKVGDVTSGRRDRELNIFQAIKELLHVKNCQDARKILWALDRPPDDAIDWIDENIPRMLVEPADLAHVYEMLSRADIFLGRIRRRQAYGMWRYATSLMSAGVALSMEGKIKYHRFQPPSSGMMYRRTGRKRKWRDSLAEKVAEHCHTSSKEARKHYIPYLAVIFRKDKRAAERIAGQLELEDEEIGFLKEFAKS
ncbi:MAG: replication factor C large subunit [Candidatus Hadarchaeota archaeon]|nr:replication factor C large subunit [Candidatus Hadarchaeota archaeon]